MITLSEFKENVRRVSLSLGYSDDTPSNNVSFRYMVRDVNEDGARTVHQRTMVYGTTPPRPSWSTIWLRSDNNKIYRHDNFGNRIEESRISDLHESNY